MTEKNLRRQLNDALAELVKAALADVAPGIDVEVEIEGDEPTKPGRETLANVDFELTGTLKLTV